MNTPPPIPSDGNFTGVPTLSDHDAKLLKRASHAGRNLSLLAILATLGALALIAAAIFAKGMHGIMVVLASTITLIAAGYWFLAVAARRGNPNAVGVVIVAMVLQICLTFVTAGVTAARTDTSFQMPVGGLIIPILVLVALASSRKVLLELKERGLWQQVFGSAKPSGNLCLVGGSLLVAGFISMNAGSYYVGWKAAEHQRIEIQHAKAFVDLIQGAEKEFIQSMQGIFSSPSETKIEMALAKLKVLEKDFDVLKAESAGAERLEQILTTYGNGLRQWKNGLMLLKEVNPDTERVKKMFNLGDKLRTEACEAFDKRYGAKNSQREN